jgi:hypothetical protein
MTLVQLYEEYSLICEYSGAGMATDYELAGREVGVRVKVGA